MKVRLMRLMACAALLVAAMSATGGAASAAPMAAGVVTDGGHAGCQTVGNVSDTAGAPLPQDCGIPRS